MAWVDVATGILNTKAPFDDWRLSIPDEKADIPVPKLIKMTFSLLEGAYSNNRNRLIIIYPEGNYLPSLTVVLYTIINILSGKLKTEYDLHACVKGQKLKIDNYICKFDAIETGKDGIERIWVNFADTRYAYQMEKAPFFQITDTKRPLTRNPASLSRKDSEKDAFETLEANKSFVKDNVCFVSSSRKFQQTFIDTCINEKMLLDMILIGTCNSDENIEILNRGQIKGDPALIFFDNLYTLGSHITDSTKYIFININNDNILNTQLDALDELIQKNIPIIFISNTINSLDFSSLKDRNFVTLRWDKTNILPEMYNLSNGDSINTKIYNCQNMEIHYENCENNEITEIFKILRRLRRTIEDSSQTVNDIFFGLNSLSIQFLRNTIDYSIVQNNIITDKVDNFENALKLQERTLFPDNYVDYSNIIGSIRIMLAEGYEFSKTKCVINLLNNSVFDDIIILISDNEDKNYYKTYWDNYNAAYETSKNISVMYYQEFCNSIKNYNSEVIVCGWLGKKKMQRILFCNNSPIIHVLVNKTERYWKNAHVKEWNEVLKNEDRQLFDKKYDFFMPQMENTDDIEEDNANEDIEIQETGILENKFKKFKVNENSNSGESVVEAIPVTFVSGLSILYKTSYQVVFVTEIINDINSKSENIRKSVTNLEVGDFVVIRESERSIIQELADDILKKEGNGDYRKLASQWKNSLAEKRKHSSIREIYNRVVREGLKISYQSFRNWIDNDDFIAPEKKDSLLYVAVALNDRYLINNIDQIYEKCRYVRKTHVKAGKILSRRLRDKITKIISDMPEDKRTDIWDPIILDLEKIGKVRILKVTDIGHKMSVLSNHTNRLISESLPEHYIDGRTVNDVFNDYMLAIPECRSKGFEPDVNKIYRKVK